MLGLVDLLERRPAQLSGGQRQRVAMGRAIVRQPKAFLHGRAAVEPRREAARGMRASLAQLHRRLGVTTVYVTHDQVEAMTLGQRVAVMRDGRILQVDAPQRLYAEPRDLFVAGFIGSPAMNLVEAAIDGDEIVFGEFRVRIDPVPRPAAGNGRVVLGVRPESFEDAAFASGDLPTIDVQVSVLEELGSDAHVFFRTTRTAGQRGAARGRRRRSDARGGGRRAPQRAGGPSHTGPGWRADDACGRPAPVPLLRPGHRREPPRSCTAGRAGSGVGAALTHRFHASGIDQSSMCISIGRP